MSNSLPLDPSVTQDATFDAHAETYDADLNKGLRVSGEEKTFFAKRRIEWVASALRRQGELPRKVLDYGCGIGDSAEHLARAFPLHSFLGVDVSERSLEIARKRHSKTNYRFELVNEATPQEDRDLAYCNGIFHHIAPERRVETAAYIHAWLRPGGWFAFWENNPWNPGTRYVMSRIPFDREAMLVYPHQARKLLAMVGFTIVQLNFLFIFPKALSGLRKLEPPLCRYPLGAQYLLLCRKGQV